MHPDICSAGNEAVQHGSRKKNVQVHENRHGQKELEELFRIY